MVVGEVKRTANIMDGIENTGDVRLHDHRLRLKQRFDIVRKLGQGTYGKVQLGINKKTGQEVAIKTIKKCKIESEADLVRIRREVQIMSSVRHPNIVHIYEVFENSEKMILVMEYCSGGELYDYLSQKKVLQEDEARRLFRQIATAVYYCHIHKICHRDLKLENVLLDQTGSAKIADFGLSNVFKETSLLSTFCGSPLYASPEIVKGTPYIGPEVDCWSLGVLLYTLVYGAMPFDGSNFKRLVRQISNGDYYEPKNPSTASPLIRDMLTVDPLKRADIAYICDHSWVNAGCETSCLEVAELLAAETPVRLDLLLSLAPAAPSNSNSVVVPSEQAELGPEESCTDLTSSTSMAVEPSNSAEKRILELVAEGGEDAIKPSPTRTIVSATDNKRKLELAMSASGLQRKKERVASCASIAPQAPVPEETPTDTTADDAEPADVPSQPGLQTSATVTLSSATPATPPAPAPETPPTPQPAPAPKPAKDAVKTSRSTIVREKTSPVKEKAVPEKRDEPKVEETKPSAVASAADKLTSLSLSQPAPANQTPTKPKKLSIPGGNVGNFKDQFERRASLTSPPEKRPVPKPAFSASKIVKPKAQSEDRELSTKTADTGTVRLQQIGIEPSPMPAEEPERGRGGVKKTESEPSHGSAAVDPSVLLQDARRSLQNSMAKLVEEKVGEENRRRAARDIISTAIRTGKPPVPYGRSSSAGVASLASPPGTPPAPATAPAHAAHAPRVFRTEAQHRVEDHRNNRGVSVERIIPIHVAEESPTSPPPQPQPLPKPLPQASPRAAQPPLRRLVSSESSASEACSSPGEPIKKSAREFIIPIAVEGKGYVTPRQRSLEPEAAAPRVPRGTRPRRISSLVSGGESEEEDDTHMHRLRSTRAARAESVSSGEEDEEDEGFHLLTAENLFSTLLHRVRALTNRLNGEEGPGFPHHPHSLFNNLQSPFFNSPHLPRRHLFREGWGSRDLHANFDSMFSKPRPHAPRGSSRKATKPRPAADADADADADAADGALDLSDLDLSAIQFSEREMRALSGLTPALSRRLQRQLLAHLPPAAARTLRRTLSLHDPPAPARRPPAARSHSARAADDPDPADPADPAPADPAPADPAPAPDPAPDPAPPQYCTLPRLRRRASRDASPPRDRPLLSKYLTPERSLPPDEPAADAEAEARAGRRRVSRFLRSDFYDAPPDESLYERRRREKELETQRILREIREKRNRSLETRDEPPARKCLSPVGLVSAKERSRSTTPFLPMLDDIRETAADTALAAAGGRAAEPGASRPTSRYEDGSLARDSKLMRPRSYPVKDVDDSAAPPAESKAPESGERSSQRESKLVRPKSYPTSSPSPEKVYINRSINKRDEAPPREEATAPEAKGDVEVSFSITLPKKKLDGLAKADSLKKSETLQQKVDTATDDSEKVTSDSLLIKKYHIINSSDSTDKTEQKMENGKIANGNIKYTESKEEKDKENSNSDDKSSKATVKKDEVKLKSSDSSSGEKKGTIKKKIIRKVSSKSKTDLGNSQETGDAKAPAEKKKVVKKVKEKTAEDGTKSTTVTKKKSMLQTIGSKLEKFATKSSSPEKVSDNGAVATDKSNDVSKLNRTQREHSVPVSAEPPTESNLIKRAVTLTDVAALEAQNTNNTKTTVSKVLGLFKKFEPKEKPSKPLVEKSQSDNIEVNPVINNKPEIGTDTLSESMDKDKPRRPTSLLLNGLSRKSKYGRTASDSVSAVAAAENDDQSVLKNEPKNLRNTLKLDFSRLPRVKKIVPTNPVIEPQVMNVSSDDKDVERKSVPEKNGTISDGGTNNEIIDAQSRSRSRSRSTISEQKSDLSADGKYLEKHSVSPSDTTVHHPLRNHESTTPEKEDIVDRIRRKSFYSRFNEKKQRRKSSLVGPGAVEYDPLSRIHSPPAETKFDASPTSPTTYDLSPGYSIASDLSPSTERYRTLLSDLPITTRNNLRYDTYGLNDKIDTYRSLDRNDFRKYPSSRSYLDYDQPSSYGSNRYSRTKSLLDSSEGTEESCLGLRDPHKYNRTLSMYSPGNYATYRPKRTRNSAIILKESEKEPSPENILEKIRQRKKISISVTRKPDPEKDLLPRSTISPKGEGDGAECSEKTD